MDGTILLMDNSEFQIKKIKYILGNLGNFNFIDVLNTTDFYSVSGNLDGVNLVIMDLAFPSTTEGFELLAALRRSPVTTCTPVIITTKLDKVEYRDQALKFGVSDFIIKPYQSVRLENSIRSLVKVEKRFEYRTENITGVTLSFPEFMNRELAYADRVKQSLSILVITPLNGALMASSYGAPLETSSIPDEKIYMLMVDRIRSLLRVTDHISLNGNGDILIVLPATDSSGADTVSEKLKMLLAEEMLKNGLVLEDIFCCISVTFPKDGTDFKALMESCSKKISTAEMLERIAAVPSDTRNYANKKYKQLRKWILNF